MGKAKPRHRNNRKHKTEPNGIQIPSEKYTDPELESPANDEFISQNIIDELLSPNTEERLCALQSLVTLTEKLESADAITKNNFLKIIAPLLVDKNSEVRNFTAGILRNLSATGSVEICERLMRDDIMTPLVALLQQYSDWNPESSKLQDTDTLLQVVNILWNLCETDETALKYFTSANLLGVLLRCLDYKTVGLDLSIAVCQCLNAVSEDNAAVISVLRNHESDLLNLLTVNSADNKLLLLKTLAAGIVVNLTPSSPWLVHVLAVVHEALGEDLRGVVGQLSSQLPLDNTTLPSAETQVLLDNTQALTEAQIMALEILTNLTSSQDDEMDVESEMSDDEDDLSGWSETDNTQPLALNPEIHEGLGKYKLVSAVNSKLESLPENIMDIISTCSSSRTLAKRVVRLQCRAFLCFNNLVSVVDIDELGGPHHLYSMVRKIFLQKLSVSLLESGKDSNFELVEASTAAIRAILLRLASIKFSDLGEMHYLDLEAIFKLGLCPELRVQANVIRIIGMLGVLLVNNNLLPLVKMAGQYLLEMAEKQIPLWLISEALDSLVDVFAEDCTDQVAAEIGLVPRLQALSPRLKSKMRQERRMLGEHYAVVSTVMSNLSPFIKYKGARVAALSNP